MQCLWTALMSIIFVVTLPISLPLLLIGGLIYLAFKFSPLILLVIIFLIILA